MQPTLFPLPPPRKKPRPKRTDNQVTRCKRCWGSKMSDKTNAYCHRLDLCLYYEDGAAKLTKDDLIHDIELGSQANDAD